MIKTLSVAVLAVGLMASPVFAGGSKGCCAKTASNDKTMCVDFASLNVTPDQKSKLEAWQSDCVKAGCTKESRAKFLHEAKGILSADQYAKLKEQCKSKKAEA